MLRRTVIVLGLFWSFVGLAAEEPTWKAGFSKVKITPAGPMWMSGYTPRLATQKLHDLWAKVLVLEAADGNRAVLITADVCGFSKQSYEAIVEQLERRHGLRRPQIMLTCTHTHTGPATRDCLHVCWPWEQPDVRKVVEQYTLDLEAKIVDAVREAVARLEPARIFIGEGSTDFAVNRRNNKEADVPAIRQRGEELRGPVDHSVPVLAVRSPEGKLRTVVCGYACHATTLASLEWSGDYPGFAMRALENNTGAEAMFFSGCSGDQNPIPRRSVEICREYGERLAKAVGEVLKGEMREVTPVVRCAFAFQELTFKTPLTREFLAEKSREKSPLGVLAGGYLARIEAGEILPATHPYAVQVWRLGEEDLWISLSGEVVVDYALKYKAKYGLRTWVNGYAQDLVCYIPSTRILQEGGGQEVGVPWDYGIPFREWEGEIEKKIDSAVDQLVQQVRSRGAG